MLTLFNFNGQMLSALNYERSALYASRLNLIQHSNSTEDICYWIIAYCLELSCREDIAMRSFAGVKVAKSFVDSFKIRANVRRIIAATRNQPFDSGD